MTDDFELDLSEYVEPHAALNRPNLVMLAGESGAGKTYSALSASNVEGLYPMLYLDTEGSTVGVINNFDEDRVDVVRVDNHKKLMSILKALETKTHKYKSVVIDTLDGAQERAIKKFQQDNPNDGFAAWGEVKEWLISDSGLMHTLRRADYLGIVVIHTREEKSDSGALTQRLLLSGAAKDSISSIPDAVLYQTRKVRKLEGEKEARASTVVYTVGTKEFSQAKNRFDLPLKMADSTLESVFETIASNDKH